MNPFGELRFNFQSPITGNTMKNILIKLVVVSCGVSLPHLTEAFVPQNPARVAQIATVLKETPSAPGASISDRAVWNRLAATADGKRILRSAKTELKKPIPDCPDSLYLEFTTPGNGNRTHYEKPYFARTSMLQRFVLGECLENKGRFLPKIVECIETLCAERSWTMPAHDRNLAVFHGKQMNVDLGGAHRALELASTLAVLNGVLPPETVAKARAELERRTFAPMRRCCLAKNSKGCSPMWWFQGRANWTAVCHSCVVRAALAVVEDRNERAIFVEGAERSVPGFLSGFTEDGYCSEGLGYWNYGWGNFLMLALAVREATDGKLDFCASAKARTVMKFGTGVLVAGGRAAPIADGGGNLENGVLQLGHLIWPDLPMTARATVRAPLADNFLRSALLDFGQWDRMPKPTMVDYPIRTEFPFAQMFVLRPGNSDMPFRLSVKAGHNDEFHNHNDIGTYAVFIGEDQLAGDPGGSEYTAKTFGEHRYEIKIINSYGHPVPVLNGCLQKPGPQFAGKILNTEFSAARDTVTFDICGGYGEDAAVQSLVRTFVYDRENKTVTVTDNVTFKSTGTFSVPVLTAGTMEPSGGEGRYRISVPARKKGSALSARVEVNVEGSPWHIEKDTIPNPNRMSPNRYAITLKEPVRTATVSVRYAP